MLSHASTPAPGISPLESLPIHLLELITDELSVSDRSALVRVSKHLRDIVTPVLYHRIILDSPHQVLRCLRSLRWNKSAARTVKQLTLNIKNPTDAFASTFSILAPDALSHTTQLTHLELGFFIPLRGYDNFLTNLTFPHLRHFLYASPMNESDIIPFLVRHPSIGTLSLGPVSQHFDSLTRREVGVAKALLPNLVRLEGPLEFGRVLVPLSNYADTGMWEKRLLGLLTSPYPDGYDIQGMNKVSYFYSWTRRSHGIIGCDWGMEGRTVSIMDVGFGRFNLIPY
ncbi:hypothetical protein JAAARDRAFT_76144 [Jaapia argillacea MUCL 33604]|uniref:F-box domain-containing protein n=1 Tax=Jaapia argillacea MUCL 33604 TaxID=933084 RepID=A0A067QHR2_9AGAM|nr:hypothetical protein JAAARDRAFT_76144 [Jaapia argillacea MUCL 33604]